MSELRLLKHYHMDEGGTSICIVRSKASRVWPHLTRRTPVATICATAAKRFQHFLILRSL